MKEKKTIGFYIAALAGICGIISVTRYMNWAPSHNSMDYGILIAIILGIVLDIFLFLRDNNYVIIATTICYSFGCIKLLTDSVGSFVDAFQGINMFGDATQVGTVISLSIGMAISILLSIIASFCKRAEKIDLA